MIDSDRLGSWLLKRYPTPHQIRTAKDLYEYTFGLKNRFMRKSPPLSKVVYDDKVKLSSALGLHAFVSRVQGGKLKSKNEIRIASVFKQAPEEFLRMIIVHELAHFKEKEHNKAFYQLCQHMEPDYHQLELDTRLYLTYLELSGPLY
nr:YgjP-like metallopeptidase domain-containing protein [Sansalvadorimonas sp. 2012CJ34-2]